MIFVTVGTHEQQFNRLVKYMDEWALEHDEEVTIQTGFSTYEPKHAKWQKLFSYEEMSNNIENARIIISHGGPASFIASLQIGKIPIVVPRRKEFDEHVNDHQLKFCREVTERQRNIIEIEDISQLDDIISRYDDIISHMTDGMISNNERFCRDFEYIVKELFKRK